MSILNILNYININNISITNIKYIIIFLSIFLLISFILFIFVSYITYKLLKINIDANNILFYQYNKQCQQLLNNYGDNKIKNIYLIRQPFSYYFTFILNLFTFYNYDKSIKHLNICPYHISLLFEVELYNKKTKFILLEKNNAINISENFIINKNKEIKILNINKGEVITLNNILEKTKNRIGVKKYFNWNLHSNNCKKLIKEILKTTNKYTKSNKKFIDYNKDSDKKIINTIVPTDFSLHIINSCVNIYNIFDKYIIDNLHLF